MNRLALKEKENESCLFKISRDNWRTYKFEQIAENVVDRVHPREANTDIYVGLEHLDSDTLKISRWGSPDDVDSTKFRFKEGDIIFGKRRCYQRKLGLAEFDGICSAHAMVLRARTDAVAEEFLPVFMQSDLFMERALEISVGSLSPTINWKTLAKQEFLLPPLDQQKRIAEILWAVESSIESWRVALDRMETLWKTEIIRSVKGKKTAPRKVNTPLGMYPKNWEVKKIGKAGKVQLGRQRAPKHQEGDHIRPYLRVANVFDDFLDLSDVLEMNFNPREFETYQLHPGDILLNEGQSRELVGRSAIFNGEIENCCFQNTLVRFRPGRGLMGEFAYLYFKYAYFKGIFASIASQTTSVAHLGADRFANLYMPIPPLSTQKQIVARVAAIRIRKEEIKEYIESLKQVRHSLRNNLLRIAT